MVTHGNPVPYCHSHSSQSLTFAPGNQGGHRHEWSTQNHRFENPQTSLFDLRFAGTSHGGNWLKGRRTIWWVGHNLWKKTGFSPHSIHCLVGFTHVCNFCAVFPPIYAFPAKLETMKLRSENAKIGAIELFCREYTQIALISQMSISLCFLGVQVSQQTRFGIGYLQQKIPRPWTNLNSVVCFPCQFLDRSVMIHPWTVNCDATEVAWKMKTWKSRDTSTVFIEPENRCGISSPQYINIHTCINY